MGIGVVGLGGGLAFAPRYAAGVANQLFPQPPPSTTPRHTHCQATSIPHIAPPKTEALGVQAFSYRNQANTAWAGDKKSSSSLGQARRVWSDCSALAKSPQRGPAPPPPTPTTAAAATAPRFDATTTTTPQQRFASPSLQPSIPLPSTLVHTTDSHPNASAIRPQLRAQQRGPTSHHRARSSTLALALAPAPIRQERNVDKAQTLASGTNGSYAFVQPPQHCIVWDEHDEHDDIAPRQHETTSRPPHAVDTTTPTPTPFPYHGSIPSLGQCRRAQLGVSLRHSTHPTPSPPLHHVIACNTAPAIAVLPSTSLRIDNHQHRRVPLFTHHLASTLIGRSQLGRQSLAMEVGLPHRQEWHDHTQRLSLPNNPPRRRQPLRDGCAGLSPRLSTS